MDTMLLNFIGFKYFILGNKCIFVRSYLETTNPYATKVNIDLSLLLWIDNFTHLLSMNKN